MRNLRSCSWPGLDAPRARPKWRRSNGLTSSVVALRKRTGLLNWIDVSRELLHYFGCIIGWYISYPRAHKGFEGEAHACANRRRLHICDSAPSSRADGGQPVHGGIYFVAPIYSTWVVVNSVGASPFIWAFVRSVGAALFLHVFVRGGFSAVFPTQSFVFLAGQFHCWFHDFHAIMGRVGVSECGVVVAPRSFAWQPECRCIWRLFAVAVRMKQNLRICRCLNPANLQLVVLSENWARPAALLSSCIVIVIIPAFSWRPHN